MGRIKNAQWVRRSHMQLVTLSQCNNEITMNSLGLPPYRLGVLTKKRKNRIKEKRTKYGYRKRETKF